MPIFNLQKWRVHVDHIDPTRKPSRQDRGQARRRHREIVVKGGGNYIASITAPWNRSIAPYQLLEYIDCPAEYLRHAEGDVPLTAAPVTRVVGAVVHKQIATAPLKRESVATAVSMAVSEASAKVVSPRIPKKEIEKAVITARSMVKVATRAARREAPQITHPIIKEPKAFFHFDERTRTFWVVKPDQLRVVNDGHSTFVGVDDTKTGRHRHRFAHLVPFMMGLVVRRSRAWEKFWGLTFNGNVKTRLVYLRAPDGSQLSRPEWVLDTIKPELNPVQKERLAGIEGYIRDIDASWDRKHFLVKPGSHCEGCDYRSDCKVGEEWLAARLAAERAES